jgi:hypothetical protein
MRLNGLQEGGVRHLALSEQAALVTEDACPVAIPSSMLTESSVRSWS